MKIFLNKGVSTTPGLRDDKYICFFSNSFYKTLWLAKSPALVTVYAGRSNIGSCAA